MFCIKICFLEQESVGAELLWVEPEPILYTYLEPEPKKISGTGAEEKWLGSATLDIDITTGKGERKLKGKGKEESKEKVSRWNKERRGEKEEKYVPVHRRFFKFYFTSYMLIK